MGSSWFLQPGHRSVLEYAVTLLLAVLLPQNLDEPYRRKAYAPVVLVDFIRQMITMKYQVAEIKWQEHHFFTADYHTSLIHVIFSFQVPLSCILEFCDFLERGVCICSKSRPGLQFRSS